MIDNEQSEKAACIHFLSHHRPVGARTMLNTMAAHPAAEEHADVYGKGGSVAVLEGRASGLLGKETGLFFIKGVAAQLCVLSAYAEARGSRNVVVHPMSHLDHDERNAIERVGHLNAIRIGHHAPFGVEDLKGLTEPLAAVVVELPLRRAGYLLPRFDELVTIAGWYRAHGVPLHFDGARVWEAAAGYGVSLERLAGLADSLYVSFYKGLGGIGGAMVAGKAEFIAALAPWKTRYGADLYTAYPQAISGLIGLDTQLPRMDDYVRRACALSVRLATLPGVILQTPVPTLTHFSCGSPGNQKP